MFRRLAWPHIITMTTPRPSDRSGLSIQLAELHSHNTVLLIMSLSVIGATKNPRCFTLGSWSGAHDSHADRHGMIRNPFVRQGCSSVMPSKYPSGHNHHGNLYSTRWREPPTPDTSYEVPETAEGKRIQKKAEQRDRLAQRQQERAQRVKVRA